MMPVDDSDEPAPIVKIPETEPEAVMMALLGMDWLEKHAPHRINKGRPVMHDDSDEPITDEWLGSVNNNPSTCGMWFERGMVVWYRKHDVVEFPGCKTRGDLRELCRLLGVELK